MPSRVMSSAMGKASDSGLARKMGRDVFYDLKRLGFEDVPWKVKLAVEVAAFTMIRLVNLNPTDTEARKCSRGPASQTANTNDANVGSAQSMELCGLAGSSGSCTRCTLFQSLRGI